jgi:hypothetical protein
MPGLEKTPIERHNRICSIKKSPSRGIPACRLAGRGLQRNILLRVGRIEMAIFFLMLKWGSCFPHAPPFILLIIIFNDKII